MRYDYVRKNQFNINSGLLTVVCKTVKTTVVINNIGSSFISTYYTFLQISLNNVSQINRDLFTKFEEDSTARIN